MLGNLLDIHKNKERADLIRLLGNYLLIPPSHAAFEISYLSSLFWVCCYWKVKTLNGEKEEERWIWTCGSQRWRRDSISWRTSFNFFANTFVFFFLSLLLGFYSRVRCVWLIQIGIYDLSLYSVLSNKSGFAANWKSDFNICYYFLFSKLCVIRPQNEAPYPLNDFWLLLIELK